jgi:hypothetical protein
MAKQDSDRHARERLEERYQIALGDQGRKEILALIRRCRWVPLELQGTRVRALLKFKDELINIVFETGDMALVTALPLNIEDLTGEQFERARNMFPELAMYGGSSGMNASKAAAAIPPGPPAPMPVEPGFFEACVLVRFGRDKKRALAWWTTPNYELGSRSPAELEACGKLERVKRFLERAKREKHLLFVPLRRETASLECAACRGYPPPDMTCRCEDR